MTVNVLMQTAYLITTYFLKKKSNLKLSTFNRKEENSTLLVKRETKSNEK